MDKFDPFLITERKQLVVNLKKDKGIEGLKAEVVLCLDFSGSFEGYYRDGRIQAIVERILPLGLAFDDNGEVDFYLFDTGVRKLPENLTLKNLNGYIDKKVLGKYDFGGTNYAPAIREITQAYMTKKSVGSVFGFGGTATYEAKQLERPVYVIFITDGDNGDKREAELAIREASKLGIFFQFVGVGNAGFGFLEKLDNLSGRLVDNANFFSANNIAKMSDADLYGKLMGEFPQWIGPAKQHRLIS